MLLDETGPRRRSGQPRVGSGRPEAYVSALAKASDLRARTMTGAIIGPQNWQAKVIRYDRDGPGVLGYYLDTVALLASLCPLVPEVQERNGRWVRSEDPVLNVLAYGYRSPLFEQHQLVESHVRAREGVGEAWIVHSREVGWHVVTVPNVTSSAGSDQGVQWVDLFGRQHKTPGDWVHKSWISDPYEPWLPHSPVRRAIMNLRRVHSAVRSQVRAADSRLISNGLMGFDPGTADASRPLASDAAVQAPESAPGVIQSYMEMATKAFTDDDSVAAHVPFPYLGKKAEYTEVGRGIDEKAMEMETMGVEGFARDVNFPAQLLTTGPGTANHWNEWILQEIQQKLGLAPKLTPVCSDITTIYFRPAVRRIRALGVGSWDVDPNRVRLAPDYSFLTSKPDVSSKAIEAYRTFTIGRDELADALGLPPPPDLPAGLSEYEHWQQVLGRPSAPYIAVDAAGRMELPPEADEAPVDGAPVETEAPMAELPAAPDPNGVTPGDMATTGGPPVPPSTVVAALGTPEDDVERVEDLLAALIAIDKGLETGLAATADAAAVAAMTAVAKAVIRAHPPRHPDRQRLRDLPAEEVWAAAAPEFRLSDTEVAKVAGEALEPFREQIEAHFEDAAAVATAAHEAADTNPLPEFLIAAGVAALLAGLLGVVVKWATVPGGFTADAVERATRKRLLRVPQSVITSAMIAAGGALVDVDGLPVKGRAGGPVPARGGRWLGNFGMASGHNSLWSVAMLPGVRIGIEWVHGFWRKPKEPFQPHVDLNGSQFDSLDDVEGGFHPQDHPMCSCAALPVLVR